MHSISRNISIPSVACKLETTCTLFCYMSSNESVRYTWTKNGTSVTGNDVTIINNVLIVTPRAEEDYGVYVCKATNSAGSAEYDVTLRKEAKSSADCNSTKEDEGKCCHSPILEAKSSASSDTIKGDRS